MLKWLTDWIIGEIRAALPLADVKVGAMPVGNGIGVYPSAHGVTAEYLTRARNVSVTYAVNAKHGDQTSAFLMLMSIHERLTLRREYAVTGESWAVRWARSASLPVYAGMEEDGAYIYGSSIEISVFKEV